MNAELSNKISYRLRGRHTTSQKPTKRRTFVSGDRIMTKIIIQDSKFYRLRRTRQVTYCEKRLKSVEFLFVLVTPRMDCTDTVASQTSQE